MNQPQLMMCQRQLTNKRKTTKDLHLCVAILSSMFMVRTAQITTSIGGDNSSLEEARTVSICGIFLPLNVIFFLALGGDPRRE